LLHLAAIAAEGGIRNPHHRRRTLVRRGLVGFLQDLKRSRDRQSLPHHQRSAAPGIGPGPL
jgi:hypothetical protein